MNLLPFNLEEALKHPERVVYRNGEKPLEWHWFDHSDQESFCIVSIDSERSILTHKICGSFPSIPTDSPYFLFLLPPPEKRYWVNVYEDKTECLVTGKICESEEECNKRIDIGLPVTFIKTISFTI